MPQVAGLRSVEYYRELKRRHLVRLFASYVAPLVILAAFFYFQYDSLQKRAALDHMKAVAADRSRMLDLCLEERLSDLATLAEASAPGLSAVPAALLSSNRDFESVDLLDSAGYILVHRGLDVTVDGPNYSAADWFVRWRNGGSPSFVQDAVPTTDGWLRVRLVVRLTADDPVRFGIATVDPQRIYNHLFQTEDSSSTRTVVLNEFGNLQMAVAPSPYPLDSALFVPPESPSFGTTRAECRGSDLTYAYDKLRQAAWQVVVVPASFRDDGWLAGFRLALLGFSLLLALGLSIVVISRAESIVRSQMDSDRTRAQLEHAAKLASVGELAAGIAHEINNPLAVISEEAGLMADFLNPQLSERPSDSVLVRHLDSIQEAVFRCRDITRRLLRFVRKTEVDLRPHNIHALIDAVVDGPLGAEVVNSAATIVRRYDHSIPSIQTDRNQFHQVLVNILKNAIDALEGGNGTVTITTGVKDNQARVAIADTGHGMTPDQMQQLFVPFYTTKGVGKGTGLGLSVSYGIMRSLGGSIEVASEAGKGSVFTLVLPLGS